LNRKNYNIDGNLHNLVSNIHLHDAAVYPRFILDIVSTRHYYS
jgi:hypothetical protein